METCKIDLYKYFGIERKEDSAGYLTTYIHNVSKEYCGNRLRPAMVVFAGGGYFYRSDREAECVALTFLAKNYNTFIMDYSVAPVSYPTQLIEACMAIAYIRENSEALGVRKDNIAAIGFSAGGHLVAMLGSMYNEEVVVSALKERSKICAPDRIILSYPVITSKGEKHRDSMLRISGNDPEIEKYLSIEDRVTGKSVPAFIWTTVNDGCVPSENSLFIAMAYKKAGVPFELHMFENGNHGLSLANEEVNAVNVPVSKWVELAETWLKAQGFSIIDKK